MSRKKIILFVFLFLCLGVTGLQAQEAIPASGGLASGSKGTVSYTMGQVGYTTNAGANGSVAQGVQQPFEISVVTTIKEAQSIKLQYVALPNPTNDNVKLKVEDYESANLRYQLLDLNGKLLESKKIIRKETSIVMINLPPSTYFLKVVSSANNVFQQEVKTFKIVKN